MFIIRKISYSLFSYMFKHFDPLWWPHYIEWLLFLLAKLPLKSRTRTKRTVDTIQAQANDTKSIIMDSIGQVWTERGTFIVWPQVSCLSSSTCKRFFFHFPSKGFNQSITRNFNILIIKIFVAVFFISLPNVNDVERFECQCLQWKLCWTEMPSCIWR